MRDIVALKTGGVAALNHRLIAVTPSEWSKKNLIDILKLMDCQGQESITTGRVGGWYEEGT